MILAILAAFVGPYFVDWTAYRPQIEAEASRLAGMRVRVLGGAEVRLLPTPWITLDEVRVGAVDAPLVTARRVYAEIDLPSLLKGEIHVLSLGVDAPVVNLSLAADGRLAEAAATGATVDPATVSLDAVTITDGTVAIAGPDGVFQPRAEDIDLTLDARSLAGPYKADGTAVVAGVRTAVRIGTGAAEAGGVRVLTQLSPERAPITITADGLAGLVDGVPGYHGTVVVTRILDGATPPPAPQPADRPAAGQGAAEPARLEGKFALGEDRLELTEVAVSYGPAERPIGLTGQASLTFAPVLRFDAALSTRQLDLDRLAGVPADRPEPPTAALDALFAAIAAAPLPTVGGSLRLEAPALVAGGAVLQGALLDAETTAVGWRIRTFSVAAPGRSTFSLTGDLSTGARAGFEGTVALSSEQPTTLAAWWRGAPRSGVAAQPLSVDATVSATAGGVRLPSLRIASGGTALSGDFGWRRAGDGTPGRFEVDLGGPVVDLDALAALARLVAPDPLAGLGGLGAEASVKIAGDKVRIGGVEGGGFDVSATFADGALAIDRLALADLAGARVEGAGRIEGLGSAPAGRLDATVVASRLEGLATLVGELLPDTAFARWLAAAAPALAPADLAITFGATPDGDAVAATLALDGTAAGSTIKGSASFAGKPAAWREGEVASSLAVTGGDATQMLAQLGLPVLPVPIGPGSLSASLSGHPDQGLAATLSAEAAKTRLTIDGNLTLPEGGPVESGGRIAIESQDLGDIALAAGRVTPMLDGGLPAELQARFEGLGSGLAIRSAEGTLAGVTISGQGALDFSGPRPLLTGELTLSEADLATLTEVGLGTDVWVATSRDKGVWPERAFSPPVTDGLDMTVSVTADTLWAGPWAVQAAKFGLRSAPGSFRLDEVTGRLAGGRLDGGLAIRVEDGTATVDGRASLADGDAAALVWAPDGRPAATGSLDFAIEAGATGRSAAGLAATLKGTGSFDLRNAALAGLDPAAFRAAMAAADHDLKLDEASVAGVFLPVFDAGALDVDRIAGSIAVTDGKVAVANAAVTAPDAGVRATASYDVVRDEVAASATITVDPAGDGVAGTVPSVDVTFAGPVAAPRRSVDVTSLLVFLTLRQSDREARRIEALEAEIRERQARAEEARRRLEAEQRAREAEATRLRAHEAKQRAEAARRAEEAARAEEARREDEATRRAEEGMRQYRDAIEAGRRALEAGEPLPPLPPPVVIDRPPGAVAPGTAPLQLVPAP